MPRLLCALAVAAAPSFWVKWVLPGSGRAASLFMTVRPRQRPRLAEVSDSDLDAALGLAQPRQTS